MKSLLRLLSVFALTCVFASNAWADKPKVLQLKDLEPGTKAIGFSVFKGVEPQPFEVVLGEAIDELGNSFILARISGGPMETLLEKIGAIGGMSGSPVFVDCINRELSEKEQLEHCIYNGTLVGALSYATGSFIEGGPNALLTPAEYMLGARVGGYVAASQFSNDPPNKISIGGKEFISLLIFPKMETQQIADDSNGRCKESVKSDIKPGSMISVFLATGAINVGASGTVTWRDDDKIYVFGHPLMGSGLVSYPFIQVSVADTLQTPVGASKLTGCYLETKGAMLVDGAFEMAGVIGGTVPMLSYQVELYMGNGSAILKEEIASSPMSENVIKILPVVWAEQLLGDLSHFSIVYQTRMTIENQPEIFFRSFIPTQIAEDPFTDVFNNIYHPIQVLKESGFNYRVESIKVRLDIVRDFEFWTVTKSFLSQKKANPGETIYANIVLEEYFSSDTKQMSIPIKVPDDFLERIKPMAPPNIVVLVQGGSKFTDKREQAEIASVEDLIKQLNQSMNHKTNVLYVQQIMPKPKVEQDADIISAKASVKPAWKWTDVGENDLTQLPSDNKNDIVLTLSPPLNGFIDLSLSFNLEVQSEKSEPKKRKWFWPFNK